MNCDACSLPLPSLLWRVMDFLAVVNPVDLVFFPLALVNKIYRAKCSYESDFSDCGSEKKRFLKLHKTNTGTSSVAHVNGS